MKRFLPLMASIALTVLVFGMSGQTGEVSASLSGRFTGFVADLIHGMFPRAGIDFETLHLIVRKGAHVAEYLLLGASYALTARVWKIPLWIVPFAGVVVALLDEASQNLVVGRGPSLVDALAFDLPGFLLGAASMTVVLRKKAF